MVRMRRYVRVICPPTDGYNDHQKGTQTINHLRNNRKFSIKFEDCLNTLQLKSHKIGGVQHLVETLNINLSVKLGLCSACGMCLLNGVIRMSF